LGVPVDVLTPNALPEKFRSSVIAGAMPIWRLIHSVCRIIWSIFSKP
jgi:hypothetical protein